MSLNLKIDFEVKGNSASDTVILAIHGVLSSPKYFEKWINDDLKKFKWVCASYRQPAYDPPSGAFIETAMRKNDIAGCHALMEKLMQSGDMFLAYKYETPVLVFYREAILAEISRLKKDGAKKVILVGHSAGSAIATDVLFHSDELIDGVFSLSPTSMNEVYWFEHADKYKHVPIRTLRWKDDPLHPASVEEGFSVFFKFRGFDIKQQTCETEKEQIALSIENVKQLLV